MRNSTDRSDKIGCEPARSSGVLDADDEWSQFSREELDENLASIARKYLPRIDARPAHSTIIVDDNGTRTIFSDSTAVYQTVSRRAHHRCTY